MLPVDTLKSVCPPLDNQKNRKTRIKESGVQSHKKRSNLSKKLHDMGDDVMDIHASQRRESDGRSSKGTMC
ncbi:hypothetical protein TNCV_99791 [Trichonephila clavipes]|nr:hypothetical protein TNCV_99791 [Trichonephila clavipes]